MISTDPKVLFAEIAKASAGYTPDEKAAVERHAADALSSAVIWLLLRQPFFGTLICETRRSPDWALPTMAVGIPAPTADTGVIPELRYNPEFVRRCTPAELRGVLMHEVCHLAYFHLIRIEDRDQMLWNVAADHAVNLTIRDAQDKGVTLPDWVYCDEKYRGMSAEEIYRHLRQKRHQQAQSTGPNPGAAQGSGGMGQVLDTHEYPGVDAAGDTADASAQGTGHLSPAAQRQIEDEMAARVFRAAEAARQRGAEGGRGLIPHGIEEMVRQHLQPKISWQDRLRHLVLDTTAREDYQFNVRSVLTDAVSRAYHTTTWVPALGSQRVPQMVCVVDTSGSVSIHDLSQFWGEIDELRQMAHETRLIMVDAGVQKDISLTPYDLMPETAVGRGGTDFSVAFQYIAKAADIEPTVCIYFTDGECPFPEKPPPFPVIWAIVHNTRIVPPWGETVYITNSQSQ